MGEVLLEINNINNYPNSIKIISIYPNPSNANITIEFISSRNEENTIEIFDILGRQIKSINIETKETGDNKINWNGTNNFGTRVPSGVYFISILNKNDIDYTRKITTWKILILK